MFKKLAKDKLFTERRYVQAVFLDTFAYEFIEALFYPAMNTKRTHGQIPLPINWDSAWVSRDPGTIVATRVSSSDGDIDSILYGILVNAVSTALWMVEGFAEDGRGEFQEAATMLGMRGKDYKPHSAVAFFCGSDWKQVQKKYPFRASASRARWVNRSEDSDTKAEVVSEVSDVDSSSESTSSSSDSSSDSESDASQGSDSDVLEAIVHKSKPKPKPKPKAKVPKAKPKAKQAPKTSPRKKKPKKKSSKGRLKAQAGTVFLLAWLLSRVSFACVCILVCAAAALDDDPQALDFLDRVKESVDKDSKLKAKRSGKSKKQRGIDKYRQDRAEKLQEIREKSKPMKRPVKLFIRNLGVATAEEGQRGENIRITARVRDSHILDPTGMVRFAALRDPCLHSDT